LKKVSVDNGTFLFAGNGDTAGEELRDAQGKCAAPERMRSP